ncbi:hypothetical protein F442_04583 [Phytophthora nicotianae P10297]|uniref:Uncharacterized protein n=4 Tax=Phytophthora nicotianae TaxID=4792 RepID=V9FMI2_PHYNI|nr:hypothetical protein F443_04542 [Phytophthora nicotianae P1569]ETK92173.1 hypothetical protein L915_04416 [Phytophthora nicotianae]ETO81051.1 hypothetical protein F444_04568 [Phytophthora nicotianae P1976]ETP50016.1 hypothetical protein F442_04583 [Phytophthora nicotianae P10297]
MRQQTRPQLDPVPCTTSHARGQRSEERHERRRQHYDQWRARNAACSNHQPLSRRLTAPWTHANHDERRPIHICQYRYQDQDKIPRIHSPAFSMPDLTHTWSWNTNFCPRHWSMKWRASRSTRHFRAARIA